MAPLTLTAIQLNIPFSQMKEQLLRSQHPLVPLIREEASEWVSPQSLCSSLPGSETGGMSPTISFCVPLNRGIQTRTGPSRSRRPQGHQGPLTFRCLLSPPLGQSTVLSDLDIRDMLPENVHHYYSYKGSLTTPPCTENVYWFVLASPIMFSRAQVTHGITPAKSPLLTAWLTGALP